MLQVIPEYSPCFLYYDLEFETELNKEKDGVRMTRTLIHVTCEYIRKYWEYSCDTKIVINLDSSRQGKFSKHLIFSTKEVAFENNYHVGNLVKLISTNLISYLSEENSNHDILSKFDRAELEELFVETNKGKKLFIDLNVYTKNRHFRTYKATKWGKNSHLMVATDNEYICDKKIKKKEKEIFLNSLITYMPKKKKLKLLSFDDKNKAQIQCYSHNETTRLIQSFIHKEYPKSPYPALDKYVSHFVKPGKIRETKFIPDRKLVVFEILGNR